VSQQIDLSHPLARTVADVARALNKARVAYMVIGGVANAIWGEARVTLDVDITVAAAPPEAPKILKALGRQVKSAPPDPIDFAAYGVLPFNHVNGPKVELAFGTVSYVYQAMERVVDINILGARPLLLGRRSRAAQDHLRTAEGPG